jgi:metal-dependent hydrolase (beta-lactamase superfamily II)
MQEASEPLETMSHPGVANLVRNTKYMCLIVTTLILGIHFTSDHGAATCV